MKINSCRNFFGYGEIKSNIVAESFVLGDEIEECSSFINRIKTTNVYFITTKTYTYPIEFLLKKRGAWKGIEKKENLKAISFYEKNIELQRFGVFFCAAHIPKNYINTVIRLLLSDYRNSFILLSNQNCELNCFFENIKLLNNNSDYCIDFLGLINRLKRNDVLITAIKGFDGTTLNFFSEEIKTEKQSGEKQSG